MTMPHTNTIEALTLELDRVNQEKQVMLNMLISALPYIEEGETFNKSLGQKLTLSTQISYLIQKAESR